jgi:hypothetical protein
VVAVVVVQVQVDQHYLVLVEPAAVAMVRFMPLVVLVRSILAVVVVDLMEMLSLPN